MKSNKAFTLIELLVVVLIIGILAAIAVPQYQKAVLNANLHRGIPLAKSIYQAQQAYILAHGDFAQKLEDLDISFPLDETCTKTDYENQGFKIICDWGRVQLYDNYSNIYFLTANREIGYLYVLKDRTVGKKPPIIYTAGERWCFANPNNATAKAVCQNNGGTLIKEDNNWARYKIIKNF